MSINANEFNPDYAIHPGEYLEEVLEARGLPKSEFAERCDLSPKTVSQIINGHVAFSPDVALQFETVLGISARIWTGMLASYQLSASREEERARLLLWAQWAAQFPLADLRKLGIIGRKDRNGEWVRSILIFFGVSSPDAWEQVYGKPAATYRKSQSLEASRFSLATWLRLAEEQAAGVQTRPFDQSVLRSAIEEIRQLTRETPAVFEPRIRQLCADAGVAVVFVPEVSGARVSGATRWLSPVKAMVAQSLRHKSDDHFWFTLFHELGHVLLHGKRDVFVDQIDGPDSREEQEANEFARSKLVPRRLYSDLVSRTSLYPEDIAEFAEAIEIAPGIVVGMLQHDRRIPYNRANGLKRRFEFQWEPDSTGGEGVG